MSVCSVDDGGAVTDEHCPLHSIDAAQPSVARLLRAEQAVLQVRACMGCVCVCACACARVWGACACVGCSVRA